MVCYARRWMENYEAHQKITLGYTLTIVVIFFFSSEHTNTQTKKQFTFWRPFNPITQLDEFVEPKTKLKSSVKEWYNNLDVLLDNGWNILNHIERNEDKIVVKPTQLKYSIEEWYNNLNNLINNGKRILNCIEKIY